MNAILAQTFTATQAAGGFTLSDLGPLVAILSLLAAGWQRVKASNYRAMLHAAAIGLKAAMDALPKGEAEEIKEGIKAAVGDLNEPMKAEVRKATQPGLVAYREDGLPKLAILMALCLGAGGCVSAAIHESALEAQRSATMLHKASVPNPGYTTDADKAAWSRLWESHEAALAAIEDASK